MKRIKRLVYLGGLYSIGSLLEKGMSFFFIPIYTTYLATADYGIIGLMWVTVGICGKLFYPPINQGFIRHYFAPEFKDKQGLLLFNSLFFLTLQSLFFSLVFFGFSKTLASLILNNEELIFIVQVYAVILFFHPLSEFLLTLLKQIEKAKLTVLISWAHSLIYAGTVLSGLIIFDLGVMALVYGTLVGVVFKACCIFPTFWRESEHRVSFSVLVQPLKYGYPRIISGCSNLLIQSGDRYVLMMFSTLSSVGLYSFGYQIAGIINILIVLPLTSALLPITFKQEGDPVRQKEFLRKTCTYFYLAGMFVCLFLSLFSKEAIEIVARKEEFWGSWVVVPVIAYSYILAGLGSFFDWGLVMTKNGFRISVNVLIGALVNIGLNFLLIPKWGIMGAAFATLCCFMVLNGLRLYCSAKFFDLHFDLARLSHITVVGVGVYLLSLGIANTGTMAIDLSLKFFILLSYILIIFSTGFFTPTEKKYLQKLWDNIRLNGLRATYAKVRALN
ncbi:MAG: hypothetical protein NPINA01_14670 [Nitrospinaceae bacterium]|nr:MAG: hypothetical protein NPINA01_14670 [Nitrospinaceae bacterium]